MTPCFRLCNPPALRVTALALYRETAYTIIMSRMFFSTIFLFVFLCPNLSAQAVLLDISLPITGKSSHAVARTLERVVRDFAKEEKPNDADSPPPLPTVILQFRVGVGQEAFGRGSSFGACYEIADLIVGENFNGIRTVAYFPQSVKGHALLVALACDELIVAEDAEIGEAGVDEQSVSSTQRAAYREISQRRRKMPPPLVDKLLDSSVELLQVETEKGLRLATPPLLDELRQSETFAAEPQVLIPAGQPGLFTADAARRINLVDLLAKDRVALARGLGFRPDDIKNAPVPGEVGHAVRIDLSGPLTMDKVAIAMRSIQSALDSKPIAANNRSVGEVKIDFICLWVDSPGGNLSASLTLASFLVKEVDTSKVRTVAYVPYRALSDAALIAIACDEIVLGPDAVLGGDGAVEFTQQQVADNKNSVVDFITRESVRSWSLPLGFIDRNLEVRQMTRKGHPPIIEYFCDEELDQQPDADLWTKGPLIKEKGKLFKVVGGKGEQFVVDRIAADFTEFKFLFGLENDPLLVAPTWADQLVRALSSPGMSAFLIFIAFCGAYFEAKVPMGIGAFLCVMSLVLFFWLNFLGGTAGWLEILLFLFGVICLLLEIFVLPGFGIFGIGGAVAVIVSLVLASQTFIIPQNSYQFEQFQRSLLVIVFAGSGVVVLAGIFARVLHDQNKPQDTALIRETEKLADYAHLLGRVGLTTTPLVPAGKAIFGDEPVNVVSDGELIETDVPIEVIEVVGYRIVVRQHTDLHPLPVDPISVVEG